MSRRKTTEEFIAESITIHGDAYDYSNVKYTTTRTKVSIVCPAHGEFKQRPYSHLQGFGCNECGIEKTGEKCRKSERDFITESIQSNGKRYDYSKVKYTSAHEKVIVTCPIHGDFNIQPNDHVHGVGCAECGTERMASNTRITQKEFIETATAAHNGEYDYSKVEYRNSKSLVTIICRHHGEFEQSAGRHSHGSTCPHCVTRWSDNNTLYILKSDQEFNGKALYKVGITSARLKNNRKVALKKASGFELIEIFRGKTTSAATILETALLKLGENPKLRGFQGSTEYRAWHKKDLLTALKTATLGTHYIGASA